MVFLTPTTQLDESPQAVEERRKASEAAHERLRKEIDEAETEDQKKYLQELEWLLTNNTTEPLNDSILIFPERVGVFGNKKKDIKKDDGSIAKLIIEDGIKKNAKKATNKGTVIAVGPGLMLQTGEFIRASCEKGDVVMYQQFGFSEVYINGSLCHVARAGDLLLKAKDGKGLAGF